MFETIKKHWIASLGTFFIFLAFLYFLKMAIEMDLVPPIARAAIGLVSGVSCLFGGYILHKKNRTSLSEVLSGFGVSVMYATFTYSSFSESVNWSINTVFVSIVTLSSVVAYVSYKFNMRKLIFVSMLGGLFSPLIRFTTRYHVVHVCSCNKYCIALHFGTQTMVRAPCNVIHYNPYNLHNILCCFFTRSLGQTILLCQLIIFGIYGWLRFGFVVRKRQIHGS